MRDLDYYLNKVKEWEYCVCRKCDRIRYSDELEVTEKGIKCAICGSYDLIPPAWVPCPHEKSSLVKCPIAGIGIKKTELGSFCEFRCSFRA